MTLTFQGRHGMYLDDSDFLEAPLAQLLGNGLTGGAALVQQQNHGPLVQLFQVGDLQCSDLHHSSLLDLMKLQGA